MVLFLWTNEKLAKILKRDREAECESKIFFLSSGIGNVLWMWTG